MDINAFAEKLPMYKTAYSPLYERYVAIRNVRYDSDNRPIIDASFGLHDDVDEYILFRPEELTNYCL